MWVLRMVLLERQDPVGGTKRGAWACGPGLGVLGEGLYYVSGARLRVWGRAGCAGEAGREEMGSLQVRLCINTGTPGGPCGSRKAIWAEAMGLEALRGARVARVVPAAVEPEEHRHLQDG